MNDKQKIIDRIRKLLAMAADQTSPNEAAIAASRARKLMDEWQIDMTQIPEEDDFGLGKVGKERKFTPLWEQSLAIAIGRYNDCMVQFVKATPASNFRIGFAGYKLDVQMCEIIYDHLYTCCIVECKRALPGNKYNARVGTAFKNAFSHEITLRLEELIKQRNYDLGGIGTGLMVIKKDMVTARFGDTKTKRVSIKVNTLHDEKMADELGREAGRKARIHLGVDETRKIQ